jgi:ferredoxin
VTVCPVDCFYEGPNFLAINPDECIDCGVCVPECPIDAIVADTNVDIDVALWRDINTSMSSKWPVITKKKDPLLEHEQWNGKPNKLNLLEDYDDK